MVMTADLMTRAACRDTDPDSWFPNAMNARAIAAQVRICRSCPVMTTCLNWAIDNGLDYGIFGGMVPKERRRIAFLTGRLVPQDDEEAPLHGSVAALRRHIRYQDGICPKCAVVQREYQKDYRARRNARKQASEVNA
jgi:WhiB family transcriptional regulator, redox-sensing transcriptional regulator